MPKFEDKNNDDTSVPENDIKFIKGRRSDEYEEFIEEQILEESESFLERLEWDSERGERFAATPTLLSVFDVAAYILQNTGQVSAMKLQKLVYYCQAWSLVWDEKPLFNEEIEAWVNGPVIPELFYHCRGQFIVKEILIGNSGLLNSTQKDSVDAIIAYYGDKTAQWLIDLSHSEKPWNDARVGLASNQRSSRAITHASMAEYYSSIQETS